MPEQRKQILVDPFPRHDERNGGRTGCGYICAYPAGGLFGTDGLPPAEKSFPHRHGAFRPDRREKHLRRGKRGGAEGVPQREMILRRVSRGDHEHHMLRVGILRFRAAFSETAGRSGRHQASAVSRPRAMKNVTAGPFFFLRTLLPRVLFSSSFPMLTPQNLKYRKGL